MTVSWVTAKDFKRLVRYHRSKANMGKQSFKTLLTKLILSKVIYYAIFLVLPIIFLPVA